MHGGGFVSGQCRVRFGFVSGSILEISGLFSAFLGFVSRLFARLQMTRPNFARLIFNFQPPQPGGRASPADENEPCRHSRRCHESAGCRLQKPAAAPSDFGPAKRDLRELSSAASECVWRQQSRVAPRLEIGRTWCAEYRQHTSHEETAKDPVARG
jgi:hypothetical protein